MVRKVNKLHTQNKTNAWPHCFQTNPDWRSIDCWEKTCNGKFYLSYQKERWKDQGQELHKPKCTTRLHWLQRSSKEAASPTAITKSHLITTVIDTKQGRDIITVNIPNAFVQTDIKQKPSGKKITMKLAESLLTCIKRLYMHLKYFLIGITCIKLHLTTSRNKKGSVMSRDWKEQKIMYCIWKNKKETTH